MKGHCAICGTPTGFRCQGCSNGGISGSDLPYYCGKEHQKKHWKHGHKHSCGVNHEAPCWKEIRPVEKLPYFVATRDLDPGHVIFTKQPLMSWPKIPFNQDMQIWFNHMSDPLGLQKDMRQGGPRRLWTCVSCYEMLIYGDMMQTPWYGMQINRCLKCSWPLHSNVDNVNGQSACELAHEKECDVLTANGLTWDVMDHEEELVYYYLGILRAVLLPLKEKQRLLSLPIMSHHFYENIGCRNKMINFIMNRCHLEKFTSTDELQTMILIMFTNSLFTDESTLSIRKKIMYIIYRDGPTGRILPHDCKPNCEVYRDPTTLIGTFKAVRPIEANDKLTITHCGDSVQTPINERLSIFAQLFMRYCSCKRCMEAGNEDETYLSTIKCPTKKRLKSKKCDSPYLVPFMKPRHQRFGNKDFFVWKCICRACPGAWKQEYVESVVNPIRKEIEKAAGGNDYTGLKMSMTKFANVLHPQHAYMNYGHLIIAVLASKVISNLDVYKNPLFKFDLHKTFLEDFEKVLERMNAIRPGRREKFAVILFSHTLLKMSELAEMIASETEVLSVEDVDANLKAIIGNLLESWATYKSDPLLGPIDGLRQEELQQLYAKNLIKAIISKDCFDMSNFDTFNILKENYSKPQVRPDVIADELTRRNSFLHVPAKDIPSFLKNFPHETAKLQNENMQMKLENQEVLE